MPEVNGDKPKPSRFKAYPLGDFHIDPAEVHTAEGRLDLLVAIDRTTQFACVELHEKATRRVAGDVLRHCIEAVPYKGHTVLSDNRTHFTTPGNVASAASIIEESIAAGETFRAHSFELACARNDIDHRLTKPRPPPGPTGRSSERTARSRTRRSSATTTTATSNAALNRRCAG